MIKLRVLKLVLSSFCWHSTIFQLYFSHKRWQWLVNSAELRWTKPKVMLSVATNYSLFYSLRRRKSIITGTTIPLYVIICRRQIARPHQNWTKCGFQDNLSGFNSLNRNVRIVACRQWGDSRVWEQITFSIRHSKLKYFVLWHWNSCISWQDYRKSVSAFLRFLDNQQAVSVEL